MGRLSRYGWRPVDPPRRPVLFVNQRSGGGRAARPQWPSEHANEDRRCRPRCHPEPGELVREAIAERADALGVAGGDGSLAVVAAAARAHGLPFVCVPAGTRNHFALDLGVDRHDLIGALDAFTDGVERSIDVAEVNGRVFLNNVSLGIYGDAVRQPAYRNAKMRTWWKRPPRCSGRARPCPNCASSTTWAGSTVAPPSCSYRTTPMRSTAPSRPAPGRGSTPAKLGVVVLDASHPGLDPPGRAWRATQLAVDASAPVHAGIDGEAVELHAPLEFLIRPGVLRVRISSRHPGVSPSDCCA